MHQASHPSFLFIVLRTSTSRPRQRGMHDHFTFISPGNTTTFTKARRTSTGEYLFCIFMQRSMCNVLETVAGTRLDDLFSGVTSGDLF